MTTPPVALAVALAAAGGVAGWYGRSLVALLAVPHGSPRRRHCPACGSPWFPRLLPLPPSGVCPSCHGRAGPPAGTVELTGAAVFSVLGTVVPAGPVLGAAAWLAACAVPLAFTDAVVKRLPHPLTAAAYAGTMLFLLLAAASSGQWACLARAAAGGPALAGGFFLVAAVRGSGMGAGDGRLAASLGAFLAWSSWAAVLAGAFAGFMLAAVYGVTLLGLRRAGLRHQIPFGPFMLAGVLLITAAGPPAAAAATAVR